VRRKETPVNSAKEILVEEVGRLSEEDAQEVLDLLRTKKPGVVTPERLQLAREELIKRVSGHPGIRAPHPNARPFRKIEPLECPGMPASELLIHDRR
jgi:hypothetical protein